DNLTIAFSNSNRTTFNIVVCHNPKILSKINDNHPIDLLLCGHTHGGQINFFGKGIYPLGKVYQLPKYDVLISNGYGTTKLPFRFCAKSETHLITLKKGERVKNGSERHILEVKKFQSKLGTKI